jgi:RNA polymerase sigma factor (sigma-70 family)
MSQWCAEDEIDPALWTWLLRYARSLVRDSTEAEDIVQDMFVVLFQVQRSGRPVHKVGAWMRTVVRNLVYRQYRKNRPDLHISLDAGEEAGDRPHMELASQATSPEKCIIDDELLRLSARVVNEFPERDRECILMYFRGYDFHQIASTLGVSRWTARRLTLKALGRFQVRMNSSQR